MSWEALGALGEIVGAVAVVGTLLYLAIQIRQVKAELHLSSLRESWHRTKRDFPANVRRLIDEQFAARNDGT